MHQKTFIANAIESADVKAQYDTQAKYVLSDVGILARILKYTVKEFMPYDVDTILKCIEGEPEVETVAIEPGITNLGRVRGQAESDQVPNEGEVTFDIRFSVITPDKTRIKILINVEAQKNFYPGYDLVTRGIYYCSRMISAQKEVEFFHDDYDNIKKVYSIWICMDAPERARNTITEYGIEQRKIYGNFQGKARYDLLSLLSIAIGESTEEHPQAEIHRMLDVLLSKRSPEQKKEILENEFRIPMSQEFKEGIYRMCNLSERVLEQGIEQGQELGRTEGEYTKLISIVRKKLFKWISVEECAEMLEEDTELVSNIYQWIHDNPDMNDQEIYTKYIKDEMLQASR